MRVRLLLDEDTEKALKEKLEKAGHDVERVVSVDELGAGSDDVEVRDYARETGRFIITYDDHFLAFDLNSHPGIFFMTNQQASTHQLFTEIQATLKEHSSTNDLPKHVFISV